MLEPYITVAAAGAAPAPAQLCVMQDPTWLERGKRFAAFMLSPTGKADWHTPDHPTSLYEGAAGGMCLLAELQAVLARGKTAAAAAAPAGADDVPAPAAAGVIAFPLFELWS